MLSFVLIAGNLGKTENCKEDWQGFCYQEEARFTDLFCFLQLFPGKSHSIINSTSCPSPRLKNILPAVFPLVKALKKRRYFVGLCVWACSFG